MKRPPYIPASATAASVAVVLALVFASCAQVHAPGDDPRTREAPDRASTQPSDNDDDQDAIADYVEYRSVPELSQVQISTGIVRGKSAVERMKQRCDEFTKRGIYPCVDKSGPKAYRRSETMDGHLIEMILTIDPPPPGTAKKDDNGGADDHEQTWIRHVVIRIDGHKKFNCSIGDSPTDDLVVYGISIYPEDGTVDAAASDFDGYELTLPTDATKIDSPTVIRDDLFEDQNSMDDVPDDKPPAPVKVMLPTSPAFPVKRSSAVSKAHA
jgi:hypothetical protein